MHAHVRLLLPDGSLTHLLPGDLIGRTWTAALRLDDPYISEAHAMVSLRGGSLMLLALRGRFLVDGQAVQDVELRAGQELALAPDLTLRVDGVSLPETALAIEGDTLVRQVLTRTCSLRVGPPASLEPGARREADARFWFTGQGWRARVGDEPAVDLEEGRELTIGEQTFRTVSIPLRQADADKTRAGVDAPLTIRARFDTVHIHRDGQPPVVLTGQLARILSEVATVGVAIEWESLAGEIWSAAADRHVLRRRWDAAMVRLRARLREAGIRPDLVRPSGSGLVELVLGPGDQVVDEG